MRSEQEREAHRRFVQALQHEHVICTKPGCGGPMQVTDHTPHNGKVKKYEAECEQCHAVEQITGKEEHAPPWDIASITMMAEIHLLHDQPTCPVRRHAHYLHFATQSPAQSSVPPPVLLLRPAHRNELAASGSQTIRLRTMYARL